MSKQIVIIEADYFRREGMTSYLTNDLHHEVRSTADSRTGWLLITELPPHVVIIGLPHLVETSPATRHSDRELPSLGLVREIKQLYPNIGLIIINPGYDPLNKHFQELRQQYSPSIQFMAPTDSMPQLKKVLTRLESHAGNLPPGLNEEERQRLAGHLWAMLGDAERPWIEATLTRMPQLTNRDWQFISLLGQSLSSQGIADKLDLSRPSVDNAISLIYAKLGLNALRQEAPELRATLILVKANTLYTLRRPTG